MKVYIPYVSYDYEGENILTVCLSAGEARQALIDGPAGYDWQGIMVFEINGDHLCDDPDDFLTALGD